MQIKTDRSRWKSRRQQQANFAELQSASIPLFQKRKKLAGFAAFVAGVLETAEGDSYNRGLPDQLIPGIIDLHLSTGNVLCYGFRNCSP